MPLDVRHSEEVQEAELLINSKESVQLTLCPIAPISSHTSRASKLRFSLISLL
jgi:hypothetical protein